MEFVDKNKISWIKKYSVKFKKLKECYFSLKIKGISQKKKHKLA